MSVFSALFTTFDAALDGTYEATDFSALATAICSAVKSTLSEAFAATVRFSY